MVGLVWSGLYGSPVAVRTPIIHIHMRRSLGRARHFGRVPVVCCWLIPLLLVPPPVSQAVSQSTCDYQRRRCYRATAPPPPPPALPPLFFNSLWNPPNVLLSSCVLVVVRWLALLPLAVAATSAALRPSLSFRPFHLIACGWRSLVVVLLRIPLAGCWWWPASYCYYGRRRAHSVGRSS